MKVQSGSESLNESLVGLVIDVVCRLLIEKTYTEGGFVARTHVDRACREVGVGTMKTPLLELLGRKGVLVPYSDVLMLDVRRAKELVSALKRSAWLPDVPKRQHRLIAARLSMEARAIRERTVCAEGAQITLTHELAVAFHVLRDLAKYHEGCYRVTIPADLTALDDNWFDAAFVPRTRRIECPHGMQQLLQRQELFAFLGRSSFAGVAHALYRFRVDPYAVHVCLPDIAPIPRPVRVYRARSSSPPLAAMAG